MLRYRVKGVTPLPACSCRLFVRTFDISAVSHVVSRGLFKTWLAQGLTSAVLPSNASYSVKHTVAEPPIIIATVQQVILRHVQSMTLASVDVSWCAGLWNIVRVVSLPSILDMSLLLTPSVWLPLLTCSAQMRWYVSRGGLWCIIWTVSLTTMPNIPVQKRRIDQSMYNCICPSWAVFLVMVMSTHDWSIPHVGHVQIINSLTEDWLAPTARYMFHNCWCT